MTKLKKIKKIKTVKEVLRRKIKFYELANNLDIRLIKGSRIYKIYS